jgi:tetrapyrrole methylase family protein/MazG family protein
VGVTVVGLGPGTLDRVSEHTRRLVTDPSATVVARTLHHPAATELAALREVTTCDDLYEAAGRHGDVYDAIVDRILSIDGPVVYAVPGSPLVGESAVAILRDRVPDLEVLPAESFIDATLAAVGIDPLKDGLQVLDAQDLPAELAFPVPTIIGHLTLAPLVVEVRDRLAGLIGEDAPVVLLTDLTLPGAAVEELTVSDLSDDHAGLRVSLFVAPRPAGLLGAVETMRRLRVACPWDAEQTHQSILPNLVEETFELYDALSAVGPDVPGGGDPEWGAYADAEEELGDVLLQVLFHTTMGEETGGLSLESVATQLREKLERRHPHVFGDVEAGSAADTLERWESIKDAEKERESLMDGVAESMPGIARAHKLAERAARIGFDWSDAHAVVETLHAELGELDAAEAPEAVEHEWGDVAFTLVNLARHLGVDPELALRRAAGRFEARFRSMESMADLDGLSLDELDRLWERAKADE